MKNAPVNEGTTGRDSARLICAAPWDTPRPRSSAGQYPPIAVKGEVLFTTSAGKFLPGNILSANLHFMASDRIAQALARIDAAAKRIEAAAQFRPTAPNPDLQKKYDQLHSEAGIALSELDRLIGMVEK